jgi:hypothetical protein
MKMGKQKKKSAKKSSSIADQKQPNQRFIQKERKKNLEKGKSFNPAPSEEPGSIRLDWLLNLSAFFFVAVGIIVIYGGWFIARTIVPQINPAFIAKHNDIIIKGLLYGTLLFEAGIFFKLYSLIYLIDNKKKAKGIAPAEGEWFFKLAILLLIGAACTILTTGFYKQHMLNFDLSEHALFAVTYLATYLKRCILSASFFILLAIFTQVYLLFIKLNDED